MDKSHSPVKRRIGFVGTFEVTNYGDCLFPIVHMHLLQQAGIDAEFSFHSPRPGDCPLADYGPVQALPGRLDAISFDADQLILCGGETLSLGHSAGTYNFPTSTLSAYARLSLGPIIAAARGDVQFFVHSVGMPTVNFDDAPEIARALGHASKVSVRDPKTAQRLGGAFPVEVDPVFTISQLQSEDEWREHAARFLPAGFEPGQYLCAQISAPYLKEGLKAWCEQVAEVARGSGMPILLLPICHFLWDQQTLQAARDILIDMGFDDAQVKFPLAGHEHVIATAALIGNADAMITTSLHALVTAVSFAVPFAGFGGLGKADGKHSQSLRAAGADFGIAPSIANIAETLADCRDRDLEAHQATAIERAHASFEPLVAALNAPSSPASPLSQELLDQLIAIDRMPTRDRLFEAKRIILRLLKRSSLIESALAARRLSKLQSSVAR